MRPASVKIGATAADQFARLVKGFDPFRRLAKTSGTDHCLQHADGDVVADDRASKPVKSDMLFDSDEAREVVAIFKHSFDPVLEKRFLRPRRPLARRCRGNRCDAIWFRDEWKTNLCKD
jgi:hypothetical protein